MCILLRWTLWGESGVCRPPLRSTWKETGARPTHPGAESILEPAVSSKLDAYAERVKGVLDPVWRAGTDIRRIWPDPPEGYR